MNMPQTKIKFAANILKYYVFNSSWGTKEGTEYEKLIYYWSSKSDDVSVEQQMSDCGLAEGVIHFTDNFKTRDTDDCEAIHGLKTRVVLYKMVNDYWSVMSLTVPYSVLKNGDDRSDPMIGHSIVEYHDEEINDAYIRIMMKNIYEHFQLMCGPIDELWRICDDRDAFRLSCRRFFNTIIPHLKLSPINLLSSYCAMLYLPLDNITFMMTQSFVNHIQCIDCKTIRHVMFLYNDQLVSSSLTLKDTKIVYNYLTTVIIPDVICDEISGQMTEKLRWIKRGLRVYLNDSDDKYYIMNLYRSINGATVVLFLSDSNDKRDDYETLLTKCDALMCTRLMPIATKLAEVAIRINGSSNLNCESVPSESFKYVYFNAANCAYKSNISALFDHRKLSDSEFVRLVIDIESDLSDIICPFNVREIISKTTNDSWVIVHHSDSRTFFSMLNHKNANLIEASDTVNALTAKQFKNILFID